MKRDSRNLSNLSLFDYLSTYIVVASIFITLIPGKQAAFAALTLTIAVLLFQSSRRRLFAKQQLKNLNFLTRVVVSFTVSSVLLFLGNIRLRTSDLILEGPSSDDAAYRSLSSYLINHPWSFWKAPVPDALGEGWASIHWSSGLRIGDGLLRIPFSILRNDDSGAFELVVFKIFIVGLVAISLLRLAESWRFGLKKSGNWLVPLLVGLIIAGNSLLASLLALNSIAALTVVPFVISYFNDVVYRDLMSRKVLNILRLSALITLYPEVGIISLVGFYSILKFNGHFYPRMALAITVGASLISVNTLVLWFTQFMIGSPRDSFTSPISVSAPVSMLYSFFGGLPKSYIEKFGSGAQNFGPLDFASMVAVAFCYFVACYEVRRREKVAKLLLTIFTFLFVCSFGVSLGIQDYGVFRLWSIFFSCLSLTVMLFLALTLLSHGWHGSVSKVRILVGVSSLIFFFATQIVNQQSDHYSTYNALQERRVDVYSRDVSRFVSRAEKVTLAIREFREEQEILLAIKTIDTCRLVGGSFYVPIPSCDAPSEGLLVGDRLMFTSGAVNDLGGTRYKVVDLDQANTGYAVPTGGTQTFIANDPYWKQHLVGSERIEFLVGGEGRLEICFRNEGDAPLLNSRQPSETVIDSTVRELYLLGYGSKKVTLELQNSNAPYLLIFSFEIEHVPVQCRSFG